MSESIEAIQNNVKETLGKSGLPFLSDQPLFWRPVIQEAQALAKKVLQDKVTDIPPRSLAPFIDHTLLKPEATREQILKVCQEAIEFHFAAVCVNPYWVPLVREELEHTEVQVCTVIGFPLGATSTAAKVSEAELAIREGADEIDMVLNIGELKARNWTAVYQDIFRVVTTALPHGVLTKVILETALLTEEEIVAGSTIAALAGAAFVKTSTGFSSGGATVAAVKRMADTVAPYGVGVKASGGIRSFETAVEMIKAGAIRIGASASLTIIQVQ